MGRLSIGEETNVPATPTAGNTLFSTVATPSLLKAVDDAGSVNTFALLEKAQTFTAAQVFNALAIGFGGELTIAAGVVTATHNRHTIDTEADAATDDLDTINGGNEGQMLILSSASSARDPTLKDGTGNLVLAGDFTFSNTGDMIMLIFFSSFWRELSRSDNA